jgi:hypothetical protein
MVSTASGHAKLVAREPDVFVPRQRTTFNVPMYVRERGKRARGWGIYWIGIEWEKESSAKIGRTTETVGYK